MLPLVSCIIPTKNRRFLLSKTLDYLYNTKYPNLEIIIIDDNSTDDTQQFCKNLSNIKYIHLEESSNSVSIPRNIGISHSTGKYIAHVDDDVFCLPNKFDVLVNCLENDNKLSLAYGNRVNCNCSVINDEIIIINMEDIKSSGWNPKLTWGVDGGQYIYRADVYEHIPLVFSRRGCDWEVAKSITSFNSNIGYVNELVCMYLWHENNRSNFEQTKRDIIYPQKFEKYFKFKLDLPKYV